jgi:mono/diheme cytochrome c family protein
MFKIAALVALSVASTLGARGILSPSAAQATPAAARTAKAHAGEEIFQQKCLQCHAAIEGQYSFGPNLYAEMKAPHPKKTAAEIREILKNGKGKMPSFADKLTQTDTENLIAYLRTL